MDRFPNQKYIVVETIRKSGVGVKTPVWFVEDDGLVWVVTREKTGKVKRIRNNSKVNLAVSNFSGDPKSDWSAGVAEIVQGDTAKKIIQKRNKKYGIMARLIGIFSAKKGAYVVFSIKINDSK
ncbi:MAG: PPOX class F420-dependent oxidoreductase [Candidatus Nitrosotenuis sp.]